MRRKLNYYRLLWLKFDLPAGLSVFLVALPLCLGISLASNAPVYSGIVAGIVGGVVVSLISGSALSVTGPAAGLTTIVAATIALFGNFEIFLLAVIVAGIFQIFIGILRLGFFASYFPSSVIKGMLAGIGIILISKQIPIAIGFDQPDFWRSGFLGIFSSENILGNLDNFNKHLSGGTLFVSLISLVVLFLFKTKKLESFKIIPTSLLVVIMGIGLTYFLEIFQTQLILKKTQFVSIPENIFTNIYFPDLTKLFSNFEIWRSGLIIGLVATLETLLSTEAIDKLDEHNRITPINRELFAQGIGNICCGILGAIPVTAVVVRGAANVDAGGRTKLSSFTHGIFLLLAVFFIPFLLNKIPYASLSAILLITGYNLTKPKLYKHMWSLGLKQFMPFIITIVFILVTDLLIGVSLGLLLSIYFIIQNNFTAEYKIITKTISGRETEYIKLNSMVSFLNKVNLKKTLDDAPEDCILTIDGSECRFIDYDILEVISEFQIKAADRNIQLNLIGIKKVNVTAIH